MGNFAASLRRNRLTWAAIENRFCRDIQLAELDRLQRTLGKITGENGKLSAGGEER
jgi:hypothetical protein